MTKTEENEISRQLAFFRCALAPMAGVTDAAFRSVCHAYGSHMMYTEMVSAKGLCHANAKSESLLQLSKGEPFTGLQLFGSDPDILAQAVETFANPRPFGFVDINLGCPAAKVIKNGDGSALAEDFHRMEKCLRAMARASQKPVTAKIRIGSKGRLYGVETALLLQECGVSAIAVHGRTREQLYAGNADWNAIAEIVDAVHIPVIANGDVDSVEKYEAILCATGACGAMIGRGALGNPFIFAEIRACQKGVTRPFTHSQKIQVVREHLSLLLEEKGKAALPAFRKHFVWYTKGMPHSAALRREIQSQETAEGMFDLMDRIEA
ncbi:MAG: tRNA dihydrouridine synthase DusB [Eubacteriaceae bacterium]|jgi:nifR3 family TIM-barrel protein|nr:tRNA dihydrouridine synthase DusB [Eubacteriaceae bacterium]